MPSSFSSAVFVLLFLTVHVGRSKFLCPQWCCKGPEIAELPPYPTKCEAPPNGWYTFEHWFPLGPCRSTLDKQAVSHVFVHRVYESEVFLGSGETRLLGAPFLGHYPINIMAQYNSKSCTLSGTMYSNALGSGDGIALTYYPSTMCMNGWTAGTGGGSIPFNTKGQLKSRYEGLGDCMPGDLLWVIPPEPEPEMHSPAEPEPETAVSPEPAIHEPVKNAAELNACDESYWTKIRSGVEARDEAPQ